LHHLLSPSSSHPLPLPLSWHSVLVHLPLMSCSRVRRQARHLGAATREREGGQMSKAKDRGRQL
jgi:hypothetical protein